MNVQYVTIKVDDQDKALEFYTSVLGFEKKEDIQTGPARWLTVTSPEGAEGMELVLEPNFLPHPMKSRKYSMMPASLRLC